MKKFIITLIFVLILGSIIGFSDPGFTDANDETDSIVQPGITATIDL